MAETTEGPNIPDLAGYVSVKEAARMMGLKYARIHQYIKEGRFPGVRHFGNQLALPLKEVQNFRDAPAGRKRTKAPAWRTYRSRGKQIATSIRVTLRQEMRETFFAKLEAIQPDEYTFSSNVARYIMEQEPGSGKIEILLIWKDTEMPSEVTRQQDLQRFQHDFPELDWESVRHHDYPVHLHT